MNYSFDPKNISPLNNAATPQNGVGGNSMGVPPAAQAVPSPLTPYAVAGENHDKRRLAAGTELSNARYRIERLIASGGMGAVYRALDTRFKRPCAVKEMLDEFQSETERQQSVEWFSREATLLLELNHPYIPRVRDFFVEQGRHYLVMDFIEGRTMGEVADREGNVAGVNGARGITEARARSWVQQLCNVLAYLHRQTPPVIFRDLKPANIMVTDQDEIRLIDFGIARPFQSQNQSTIIMTPGYAPPEQVQGMPEPRSDLYALGATLHNVLTRHDARNNKPLFVFPPVRSLRPDVSPEFDQLIQKAVALLPDQRWSGASEMERAVLALPPITIVPINVPIPQAAPQPRPISSQPSIGGAQGAMSMSPGVTPARNSTTGPAGIYLTTALNHIAAGRFEDAFGPVRQAHTLEPDNALVHKVFGMIFAHRQPPQVEQAMQAYNRSLQHNPTDAETHKLVGDVFFYLRQLPQQAVPAYRQALSLNANDAEAHYRLGQCYERVNQLQPALHEYQEAVRLAPKQVVMQVALGQLALRMNQLPLAEHALVQALFINAADHNTRFLLCQVYERENKLDDALRECGYVVGPLGSNQAVLQMHQRLRARLGR